MMTFMDIFRHWVLAFGLVAVTWNPTGFSFLNLVQENPHWPASMVLLLGLTLIMWWIHAVKLTKSALGWRLAAVLVIWLWLLVWAAVDFTKTNPGEMAFGWFLVIITATVLTMGRIWPDLRRRRHLGRARRPNRGVSSRITPPSDMAPEIIRVRRQITRAKTVIKK